MIHRKIKWDVKLTFAGTNACHEVGIDATIMQKEKGANSLPEAYFCSPFKVDVTCVKILHGRKMRNPPLSIRTKIISLHIKKINL